jgi:hypothetical protein
MYIQISSAIGRYLKHRLWKVKGGLWKLLVMAEEHVVRMTAVGYAAATPLQVGQLAPTWQHHPTARDLLLQAAHYALQANSTSSPLHRRPHSDTGAHSSRGPDIVRGNTTRSCCISSHTLQVDVLVGPPVFGEVATLCESLLTHFTRVRLLTCVNSNMALQHHLLAKCLWTLLALGKKTILLIPVENE